MAAQGQSFFHASGDHDAFSSGVPFPSESPNVTQVGGTTLTTSSDGNLQLGDGVELAGNGVGSSGGISTNYAIPFYQQGINMVLNQGSTTMRNVPDVALTADNIYAVFGNGTNGHSSSARVLQRRCGRALPRWSISKLRKWG